MEFLVLSSENVFINKESVSKASLFTITPTEDGFYKCNGIICSMRYIIQMIECEGNNINRIIINHDYKDISNLLITLDNVFKLALPIEDAEVQSITYGYSHGNPPKEVIILANEHTTDVNLYDNKENTTFIITKRNPNNLDIDSAIQYQKLFDKCVIIRNVYYCRYSNPTELFNFADKFVTMITKESEIVDNIAFIKLNSKLGADLKFIQKNYPSVYKEEIKWRCENIIKFIIKYAEKKPTRIFVDYNIRIDNELINLVKTEAEKNNLDYTTRHYF